MSILQLTSWSENNLWYQTHHKLEFKLWVHITTALACRFIVHIANTLAVYGAHFELSNSLEWIVFH